LLRDGKETWREGYEVDSHSYAPIPEIRIFWAASLCLNGKTRNIQKSRLFGETREKKGNWI
jgi:hypothetical protein